MRNKCKKCGNKFNEDTMKYVIETRHMSKPKLVIENLPVEKCTVCDNYKIPESSLVYINLLKEQLRREMMEMAPKEEIELEEKEQPALNLSMLKDIKKFINRLIS